MRKPIIGITSNLDSIAATSSCPDEFVFVRSNYLNAICENGGIPLIISSKVETEDAQHIVDTLDGLLLIGGQDVDPRFYGEQCLIEYCSSIQDSGAPYKRPLRDQPNHLRDEFEMALYFAAKKRKIPIVGICRGYQLINVAEGGALFQEIEVNEVMHTVLPDDIIPDHEVILHENSHAHQVFGATCFMTCSIHHQGIKHLGSDLIATGFAKDGLIEVVESPDPEHFLIGIQGHPERSCKQFHEHNSLFSAFTQACIDHRYRSQLINHGKMPA